MAAINWCLMVLAVTAGFMLTSCVCKRPKHSFERKLHDFLFLNYDPGCRPVVIATTAINVSVSLSLIQIMDLVEKNQTLITQVWIEEEWTDETLRWIPRDFGNLTSLIVPSMSIWLPDIYIFNNADRGDEGFVSLNESRVTVSHEGHVRWIVPLIVHSACAVDVTYFPFDEQRCFVRFGSWIYDEKQVNLSLKATSVRLDSYSVNSELSLLEATIARLPAAEAPSEVDNAISKQGRGPHLKVQLSIRRKPLYYIYTIVAPTLVLCALNLFSFLLPCDNGNKVGIGLTVFLSLYVLQLAIAKNIPESNTLPIIGVFLTLVMTLNAVSLVCATLIINVKKAADMTYCPSPPRPIVTFCRSVLGPMTCTAFNDVDYTGGPPHSLTPCSRGKTDDRDDEIKDDRTTRKTENRVLSGPYLTVTTQSKSTSSELQLSRSKASSSPVLAKSLNNTAGSNGHQEKPQVAVTDKRRARDVEVDFRSCRPQRIRRVRTRQSGEVDQSDCNHFELKTYTKRTSLNELAASCNVRESSMTSEHEGHQVRSVVSEKEAQLSRQEWCFLAESLDRMMFGLFLSAMLLTIIVSLVIVPESQRWT